MDWGSLKLSSRDLLQEFRSASELQKMKKAFGLDIFPILQGQRQVVLLEMLMKISVVLLIFFLIGCGGSLSDEQRKEMQKKMEENKIVRVTEVEIMEAAFAKGRKTVETLESLKNDSSKLNSFIKANGEGIRYIQPGEANARMLEQQLIDAYVADESGSLQDNVQKLRNNEGDFDSLLYTKPVIKKLPDGSEQLEGVWNIWLSKKELIVEIGKNK